MKMDLFVPRLRRQPRSGLLPPGLVAAQHVHRAVPLRESLGRAVADAGVRAGHASDFAAHVLPCQIVVAG